MSNLCLATQFRKSAVSPDTIDFSRKGIDQKAPMRDQGVLKTLPTALEAIKKFSTSLSQHWVKDRGQTLLQELCKAQQPLQFEAWADRVLPSCKSPDDLDDYFRQIVDSGNFNAIRYVLEKQYITNKKLKKMADIKRLPPQQQREIGDLLTEYKIYFDRIEFLFPDRDQDSRELLDFRKYHAVWNRIQAIIQNLRDPMVQDRKEWEELLKKENREIRDLFNTAQTWDLGTLKDVPEANNCFADYQYCFALRQAKTFLSKESHDSSESKSSKRKGTSSDIFPTDAEMRNLPNNPEEWSKYIKEISVLGPFDWVDKCDSYSISLESGITLAEILCDPNRKTSEAQEQFQQWADAIFSFPRHEFRDIYFYQILASGNLPCVQYVCTKYSACRNTLMEYPDKMQICEGIIAGRWPEEQQQDVRRLLEPSPKSPPLDPDD